MSGTPIDPNATTYAQLVADIATANGETTPGTYTIELSGSIDITGELPVINLQGGVVLILVANGATLDGGGIQAGLFVYQGRVSIEDLIIQGATAQGGNGGTGA